MEFEDLSASASALPAGAPAPAAVTILRSRYTVPRSALTKAHYAALLMEPNRGKDNAPEPYSVAYPNPRDARLVAVPRHWGRQTFGPAAHDRTVAGAPLTVPFRGTLLPYQTKALDAIDRV